MARITRIIACVLAAACSVPAAAQQVSDSEIKLGASMSLSGPLGPPTQVFEGGAKLYFEKVNAQGGIHGRKISYEVLDDAYDPQRARENTSALIKDKGVFALLGNSGTAPVLAVLPLVNELGVPLVGPATGSPVARAQLHRPVFHVRASYSDEVAKIVDHAYTVGTRRIAIFHVDDAFGKMVMEESTALLKAKGVSPIAVASASAKEPATIAAAANALAQAQPQAVIVAAIGTSFTKFVSAFRDASTSVPQFYGCSFVEPTLIAAELGAKGRGIILSQITPSVRNMAVPVVREYREALAAARPGAEPAILELDGFLTAKVMAEGLRRAGKQLTRPGLIAALEGMTRYDVGGYLVSYSIQNRNGSGFVNLAIVGADGRLVY